MIGSVRQHLVRHFDLAHHGTSLATEVRAGLVTFLTMSYILLVNPQILGDAGMPARDVAVATALAAAAATLVMGLATNYPIALAPGMGLNAYFTYGVVQGLGVDWQVALAAVFTEGVLFLVLAVTGVRSGLVRAIPLPLKLAITGGIGCFLAFIGLQSSGLVVAHPVTLVSLGDVGAAGPLLALGGIVLTAGLLVHKRHGGIMIGIAAVTATAWLLGEAPPPQSVVAWPSLPRETFLALDFGGLLAGQTIAVVLAFLFVDLFDTAGTLIGVGRLAGMTSPSGELPRADRAFTADAAGTMIGATLGTSTVTSYVESATGVEEGGRTGLVAVVVAVLFLLALPFAPLFASIPPVATAPALVVVGAAMMRGLEGLDWRAPGDAVPAFLTLIAMPLTYSIATGVSLGIVSWIGIRLVSGRIREVHPFLATLGVMLIAYYGWQAS